MKKIALVVLTGILMLTAILLAENIEFINSTLYSGALKSMQYHEGNYYCIGANALEIYSVSEIGTPSLIGGFPVPGSPEKIVVDGNHAYIAYSNGLCIIDISTLPIPFPQVQYAMPGESYDIKIINNLAYIAAGTEGLHIINISDPNNPILVGTCDLDSEAKLVEVNDTYAYVVTNSLQLEIIDISNPSQPESIGSIFTEYTIIEAYLDGSTLYLFDYREEPMIVFSYLNVYDLTNPVSPQLICDYSFESLVSDIYIRDNVAYIATDWTGLHLINVTNPSAPTHIGVYTNVYPYNMFHSVRAVEDLIVIGGYTLLEVIDSSDPEELIQIGTYDIPRNLYEICLNGNYAYLPTLDGFEIVDIHDHNTPIPVGRYSDSFYSNKIDISIEGNYAYIATGLGPLLIVNVSDPLTPYEEGYYRDEGYPNQIYGVDIVDTLAFISMRPKGFQIANIADPQNTYKVSEYQISGFPRTIQVEGDFAYLLTSYGLNVFNIADPAAPELVGDYYTVGSAKGLAIANNLAFTSDDQSTFYVIDISIPAFPTLLAACDISGGGGNTIAKDIVIDGNYAYLACRGLVVIDISNPEEPTSVECWQYSRNSQGIAVDDGYVFIADLHSLNVLFHDLVDIDEFNSTSESFTLFPNYPNPFNASTMISFILPEPSDVELEIFNILGQKSDVLINDYLPAGSHSILWQPDDLSSGIYFYKISVGSKDVSKKLMLIK